MSKRIRFPRWTKWAVFACAAPATQPDKWWAIKKESLHGVTRFGVAVWRRGNIYAAGVEHSPLFAGGIWRLP